VWTARLGSPRGAILWIAILAGNRRVLTIGGRKVIALVVRGINALDGESIMIICEFCLQYTDAGECTFGLRIPKRMGCREFDPGIDKFCSDPNDFVNPGQIIQMATFFGIKGTELKKVKVIAARAGTTGVDVPTQQTDALAANES
jgi:hypothetical protein